MILYHGSLVEVVSPDISYSRDNLDFGKGFYATDIYEQALSWAERISRRHKKAFVNVYEFDKSKCDNTVLYKIFNSYNEEWLDFIIECRSGGAIYRQYDIIFGGIANDKVFNTIELYFDGLIEKKEALQRLKYEKPNNQYCFVSQHCIDMALTFVKSEEVYAGK